VHRVPPGRGGRPRLADAEPVAQPRSRSHGVGVEQPREACHVAGGQQPVRGTSHGARIAELCIAYRHAEAGHLDPGVAPPWIAGGHAERLHDAQAEEGDDPLRVGRHLLDDPIGEGRLERLRPVCPMPRQVVRLEKPSLGAHRPRTARRRSRPRRARRGRGPACGSSGTGPAAEPLADGRRSAARQEDAPALRPRPEQIGRERELPGHERRDGSTRLGGRGGRLEQLVQVDGAEARVRGTPAAQHTRHRHGQAGPRRDRLRARLPEGRGGRGAGAPPRRVQRVRDARLRTSQNVSPPTLHWCGCTTARTAPTATAGVDGVPARREHLDALSASRRAQG
jgi:hypothetical protein